MASIRWEPRAVEDLRAIKSYVRRNSPAYAARLARDIVAATRRLKTSPRSGSIVPEINDESIREIFCHSYRVIYRVRDDECRVHAVIHGSRDLLRHVNPHDLTDN